MAKTAQETTKEMLDALFNGRKHKCERCGKEIKTLSDVIAFGTSDFEKQSIYCRSCHDNSDLGRLFNFLHGQIKH
jgi:late competence protein required for DNA uptake (superfamily II DNA/RNA helicase)